MEEFREIKMSDKSNVKKKKRNFVYIDYLVTIIMLLIVIASGICSTILKPDIFDSISIETGIDFAKLLLTLGLFLVGKILLCGMHFVILIIFMISQIILIVVNEILNNKNSFKEHKKLLIVNISLLAIAIVYMVIIAITLPNV